MANYDLALFYGHGEGDNGCVGNGFNEVQLVKPLTEKIYNYLTSQGLNVQTNLFNGLNNFKSVLTNGNTYKYKMAFSNHINSTTGGYGCEALVPLNEKFFSIEDDILRGLENIGLKNRGLKSKDYTTEKFLNRTNGVVVGGTDWLGEIRNGWKMGCSLSIIEYCFINDLNDLNMYRNNIDKIALLVANSILKGCNLPTINNSNEKPVEGIMYKIQVGAYTNEKYARQESERLDKMGIKNFIVKY